jgi:hypothetical protein
MTDMKRTIASLPLYVMIVLLVAACGIKPAEVDPPQGHKSDRFPRTYPDPATDPK